MMYVGFGVEAGKVVPAEQAFEYALKAIQNNDEAKAEFVEWFYSGNWRMSDDTDFYGEDAVTETVKAMSEALAEKRLYLKVVQDKHLMVALEALKGSEASG